MSRTPNPFKRQERTRMGDIGEDPKEYEFEPFHAPAVPEPVQVPVPEPVAVPA